MLQYQQLLQYHGCYSTRSRYSNSIFSQELIRVGFQCWCELLNLKLWSVTPDDDFPHSKSSLIGFVQHHISLYFGEYSSTEISLFLPSILGAFFYLVVSPRLVWEFLPLFEKRVSMNSNTSFFSKRDGIAYEGGSMDIVTGHGYATDTATRQILEM